MDEAGDKVIWCGGRMNEIDVLHELVKVMSVIFASYPFKARISALSLPTLFCHIIFHSSKRSLELTAKRTSRRNKLHMQNQHVLMQLVSRSKRLLALPISPQTPNFPLAIHYHLGEGSVRVEM